MNLDRPSSADHPVARWTSTDERAVDSVIVAVPARDEAGNIAACLRSIDAAMARCGVPVVVVVAADSCADDTASRAATSPPAGSRRIVVEGSWRAAGGARAAAVAAGLTAIGAEPSRVWIANTDADCTVPRSWLQTHVRHAATADAVTGLVHLDPATTPAALRRRFAAAYAWSGVEHRHVHGANLGVRGDAYATVGGWTTAMAVGEDHDLWGRLTAAGYRLRRPTDLVVTTSGRTRSRVVGGFATDLALLAAGG